jgi:DNA-binding transcriptional MerR regulator/Lon protease-like protein
MSKNQVKEWLSAVECARRTGLTVRALRVYERQGLVSPPRSDKGWRRYGPDEVARLNTVVNLKALGLTLEQIRQVISANPPPLAQILRIQTDSWKAKRAAADRALTRLEVARRRLASRALSLDELCELVKELEISRSSAMHTASSILRQLLTESLSADETQAWRSWWADHPADRAAATSAGESLAILHEDLEHLAQQHADPSSAPAQELVKRHYSTLTRFSTRERALRLMQWNPSITAKIFSLGAKSLTVQQELPSPSAPPRLTPEGAAFLNSARALSGVCLESEMLIVEVRKLLSRHAKPDSSDAQVAVARLAEICRTHDLGDPYVYVQWLRFTRHLNPAGSYSENDDAAWSFLARAMEVRVPRRKSEVSELESWLDSIPTTELPHRVVERVPVIPLRDVVIYPWMVMPIFVGRQKSAQAVELAMRADKRVILVAQRQPEVDDPASEDLYQIGTVANVLEVSPAPDDNVKVLIRGIARAHIDMLNNEDHLSARLTVLTDTQAPAGTGLDSLRMGLMTRFERYGKLSGWPLLGGNTPHASSVLAGILARFNSMDSGTFADSLAAHTPLPLAQKQEVLEMLDVRRRLEYLDTVTQSIDPPGPRPE